jgi:hypothetical protein
VYEITKIKSSKLISGINIDYCIVGHVWCYKDYRNPIDPTGSSTSFSVQLTNIFGYLAYSIYFSTIDHALSYLFILNDTFAVNSHVSETREIQIIH